MRLRKPSRLLPGDRVGIAAPASHLRCDQSELFFRGVEALKEMGFEVHYRADILDRRHLYFAGEDKDRAKELIDLLLDPTIKAIFFLRGGYGTQRMIPYLGDLEGIAPKVIVGGSDLTVLHAFVGRKWGWVTFYGPHLTTPSFAEGERKTRESFARTLTSFKPPDPIPCEVLRKGKARGVILGGCLSSLVTTLGTSYQLQAQGAILFLEDQNESPYRIDRMITHLRSAGAFEGIRGVVFGQMPGCDLPEKEGLLKEAILDSLRGDFPILFGLPSGHGPINMTIPLGVEVELDGEEGLLRFLEAGVL